MVAADLLGSQDPPHDEQNHRTLAEEAPVQDAEESVLELWHDQAPAALWHDLGMPQDPHDIFPELTAHSSCLSNGAWLDAEAESPAEASGLDATSMHAQPGMVPSEAGASGAPWQHAHPSHATVAQAAAEELGSASAAGR